MRDRYGYMNTPNWYATARNMSGIFLGLFCVVAIPVMLITINVRLAFNSVTLYEYGFETYNVSQTTGLDMTQLSGVAREIRDYFNSSSEYLDVDVNWMGEEVALFNPKEIMHMWDVKQLVRGVYRGQELVTFYIFVYLTATMWLWKWRGLYYVAGTLIKGSLLTLVILLVFGVLGTLAFPVLFQQFHILSFSNDFWILDPRYNYLTRLFTEGFFFRSVMLIALIAACQASFLISISLFARRIVSRV